MPDELFSRLETALASIYRLLRELGGGGMSRVFLAEEIELQRKVVIKVLPPEMSAGVNKERFQREIRLAASLQHPHIVPLLTAGSTGDLLYYVMPYIEGESLRAKLSREGELPIGEAARILRDVADALAAAHRRGVIHRDIKPDNVMISDQHALVTDFGVAKAVSASSGDAGSSLTSLGIALGTPAYMAPEQAAADPHTDHRADIYALGAMAYEMLTSQPPFTGSSPQSVLAAHVTKNPDPVTQRRPAVPPAMASLVMRCLEKRPADRWQSANEVLQELASMITPTAGMTPTGTVPTAAVSAETALRKSHPIRVAGLYLLAALAVLGVVYFLMIQLGLPDWLFPGAIALLAAGLPIMLITSRVERTRVKARLTGRQAATSGGFQSMVTWRRALWGGAVAFGTLAFAVTVYMLMRMLGIGPAGSLIASGALAGHDRLILTDFQNRTSDSTLGETVTELFRIDLAQSRAISILEPRQVQDVIRRMERSDSIITPELARDIAAREGFKAYIAGDIRALGSGYIVAARLVAASSGDALFSAQEAANTPDQVIHAVDRLSRAMRSKIGESLRAVRADPPLEAVTTRSTDALRLYAEANRVGSVEGDFLRAINLLRQAVEKDTLFAMAYRKLGAYAVNVNLNQLADSAATRAYALRDRLSERERLHVTAYYNLNVAQDYRQVIETYKTLLDKYPDDSPALNNLGLAYGFTRQYVEEEAVERRAVALGGNAITFANLIDAQVRQGHFVGADSSLKMLHDSFPGNDYNRVMPIAVAAARRDFVAAERLARVAKDSVAPGSAWQPPILGSLGELAALQGRWDESDRWAQQAGAILDQMNGLPRSAATRQLTLDINRMIREVTLGTASSKDVSRVDDLWHRELAARDLPLRERDYVSVISLYSILGNPEKASQVLSEFRRDADSVTIRMMRPTLAPADGWIELARGKPASLIAALNQFRESQGCGSCTLAPLGFVYDRMGQTDSAVTIWQRFLDDPDDFRLDDDAKYRPAVLRRLGEIYEQRGDRSKALDYYGQFVTLWKSPNPELQPVLADVRERMGRLTAEGR